MVAEPRVLAVREGESVEKGTLLYTLDLDTATKDGRTQQQIIAAQTAAREMLTQQIDRKIRMSHETQSELRQKIEADPKHPAMILTVPGLGYKFAG